MQESGVKGVTICSVCSAGLVYEEVLPLPEGLGRDTKMCCDTSGIPKMKDDVKSGRRKKRPRQPYANSELHSPGNSQASLSSDSDNGFGASKCQKKNSPTPEAAIVTTE
eukprot:767141-Hanusia_phi.AAC.18